MLSINGIISSVLLCCCLGDIKGIRPGKSVAATTCKSSLLGNLAYAGVMLENWLVKEKLQVGSASYAGPG